MTPPHKAAFHKTRMGTFATFFTINTVASWKGRTLVIDSRDHYEVLNWV